MNPFRVFSKRKLTMLAAACMLTAGSITASQEGMEDLDLSALLNITLETGSFLELDLRKSPVTMTLIDDKKITNSGARNLSELLETYVPGFQYMTNKWNGTLWGMRGVTSDRNDKVIVLINGKKQNLQNFHGFATEYSLGILGDIQRVEVLRGPAGLVYGSGAIAGVVNIVTKEVNENGAHASIKLESNGKNGLHGKTFEGGMQHEFQEDHTLSVHAGYYKNDGYGENIGKIFGHYEDGETVGSEGVASSDNPWATNGNFLASVDYNVKNLNIYARMSRQYFPVSSYFPSGSWASRRTHLRDNMLLGLEYGWDIGDDRLSIDGYAAGVTNEVQNREKMGEASGIGYTTGERRYETTLKYLLKRVDNLQLAVGGQFGVYDIGENLRHADSLWNGNVFVAKPTYKNIAGFTEAFYEINDVIGLEAGVRFDKHTRTDGVVSPKGAVILTPNENHTFKLIVQSSSNNADALTYEPAPTAQEGAWTYEKGAEYSATDDIYDRDELGNIQYNDDGEPITLLGNIQAPVDYVDPEKSLSFELATKHNLSDAFALAGSFSFNRMSELFMWNAALKQTVNLGEYDALNFELEADVNLDKVDFGWNAAYMSPLNLDTTAKSFTRDQFTPVYDATLQAWRPQATGTTLSKSATIEKDQISYDGKYFNSLHTVTSKFFVDWDMFDYLTLHTDMKLFFGLWGRKQIHADYMADYAADNPGMEAEFLGMSNKTPMAKWNASLHFHISDDIDLGVFAYDILGERDNRHAVRWQQMAAISQAGYYTVDQRTFALKLTKRF